MFYLDDYKSNSPGSISPSMEYIFTVVDSRP